jgi:hypothetical protein
MDPSDHLVSNGWCCARYGQEFVIYLTAGGSTTVTGLPAVYAAKWFNPRDGTNHSAVGGPVFTTPDGNDWALHIKAASSQPYHGTPAAVPGTIQAEDYDLGGEGVSYHDATIGNSGAVYRTDDVDLLAASDVGDGYSVVDTVAGEWLNYAVDVGVPGFYYLRLRTAAPASGGSLRVKLDGAEVMGPVTIPSTGAQEAWTIINTPNVQLDGGVHQLRIDVEAGGWNLNWMEVALAQRIVTSDFNADGDVDQEDFGFLQNCSSGFESYASGCDPADLDDDGIINITDFAIFESCFRGPNQDPGC